MTHGTYEVLDPPYDSVNGYCSHLCGGSSAMLDVRIVFRKNVVLVTGWTARFLSMAKIAGTKLSVGEDPHD